MNKKGLTIRESIHGNFFYHIAEGNTPLCGNANTMITSVPLSCWGIKTHLHEKYCMICDKIFKEKENITSSSEDMAKVQKPSNKIIKFLQKLCRRNKKGDLNGKK